MANNITWQPITAALVESLLPQRAADANKGTFGRCLIVAGSINYTGAAYLATSAALRSGVGLATLAAPGDLLTLFQIKLTEATFLPLPTNQGVIASRASESLAKAMGEREYAALLLGPGMGDDKETQQFVYSLLGVRREVGKARPSTPIGFGSRHAAEAKEEEAKESKLPSRLVLDADALNALAAFEGEWWHSLPSDTVITPHPGELARLLGGDLTAEAIQGDREGHALAAVAKFGCTVVLKGANTLVVSPQGSKLRGHRSDYASPLLASGGTGDVLAGIIAGLLTQGMGAHEAATVAVYAHAAAAELAARALNLRHQRGLLASDLLPYLGAVL